LNVVVSLGGSLINPGEPDLKFLREISKLLIKLKNQYKLAVVCGGGKPARTYLQAVRELTKNEFLADEIAIMATKQNASLLIAALGNGAYPNVISSFSHVANALLSNKIVVMGGTIPGITTDTDAALLAEKIGAKRLVNLSNVNAVYSSDPKKDKNAKKLSKMSFNELAELAFKSDKREAGTHFIFDLVACKIIERAKIETHFVYGGDLKEVEKAIKGEKHSGTVIK
jgi:uridylate kinase